MQPIDVKSDAIQVPKTTTPPSMVNSSGATQKGSVLFPGKMISVFGDEFINKVPKDVLGICFSYESTAFIDSARNNLAPLYHAFAHTGPLLARVSKLQKKLDKWQTLGREFQFLKTDKQELEVDTHIQIARENPELVASLLEENEFADLQKLHCALKTKATVSSLHPSRDINKENKSLFDYRFLNRLIEFIDTKRPPTWKETIQKSLQDARSKLLHLIYKDYEKDVIYDLYSDLRGESFALVPAVCPPSPKQVFENFQDSFFDKERFLREEISFDRDPHLPSYMKTADFVAKIKKCFFDSYTVDFVTDSLSAVISPKYNEQFIQWCKENTPEDFEKAQFDKIHNQLNMLEKSHVPEGEIVAYLTSQGIQIPKGKTPSQAVEMARQSAYSTTCVVPTINPAEPLRFTKTALIRFSQQFELLISPIQNKSAFAKSEPKK